MKLLKYVMTTDAGLAPNPYGHVCTLALCTPNHSNSRLNVGDWIVGHSDKRWGRKLIYAMKVTHILSMEEYFNECPDKRPDWKSSEREKLCGDNLYYKKECRWTRLPSPCHNTEKNFAQDVDKPVFIAKGDENFIYFGRGAKDIPNELEFLIQDRQGCSYVKDEEQIGKFIKRIESFGLKGKVGEPRDPLPPKPDRYLEWIEPHWFDEKSPGDSKRSPAGDVATGVSCGAPLPPTVSSKRRTRSGCGG